MKQSEYWTLNTFQKAALTYESIQAFRKVELMIQGVAFPEEPDTPANPPSFHEFAKEYSKTISSVQFGYSTELQIEENDIEKFTSINFVQLTSKYINGESIYALGSVSKPKITKTVVYPEFSSLYSDYEAKYGDAVKRKEEWQRYQKEIESAKTATQTLVSDWHEAQQNVAIYEKVKSVLEEYILMTKGDTVLANEFLDKRFDYSEMEIFKNLSNELVDLAHS